MESVNMSFSFNRISGDPIFFFRVMKKLHTLFYLTISNFFPAITQSNLSATLKISPNHLYNNNFAKILNMAQFMHRYGCCYIINCAWFHMDNSIYIVLSRQTALFRDLDVTANNLANVNTTGYNNEDVIFTQYIMDAGNRNKMSFADDISTHRNLRDGAMKVTGNALDVAITGHAYFSIETPLGTRYTRAGNFSIDQEGTLVTADGHPVLDDAGQRIQFEPDAGEIKIGEAGNISVGGEEVAVLGLAQFENEQVMERLSSNMYKSDVQPVAAENVRVLHGVLEQSNVDPIMQMTRLISLTRSVAGTAKFIDAAYDLERRGSNTLAKQSNS